MLTTRCSAIAIVAVLALTAEPVAAQAPLGTVFSYQGQLNDGGSPANGTYDLRFVLYDQLTGGIPQGPMRCADNVAIADGLFTVALDFGAQFAGQERFLEIAVRADTGLGCNVTTGFVPLSPRQALTSAPNALFALDADTLDGLNSTAFLQAIPVPLTLSGTSASHIIRGDNASVTAGAASIYGASSGATGAVYGGRFESASNSGRGAYGWASAATGTTYGVYGRSDSPSGRGVYGHAIATTGDARGVFGVSNSTSGLGTVGYATATSGTTSGVYGQSDSPDGTGVYGIATASANNTAAGVYGESAGGAGRGVYGRATGDGARGVFGYANAATGNTFGVFGESASASGVGVLGWATAESGPTAGGVFWHQSTSGGAVQGQALAQSGATYGGWFLDQSTSGTGVYGQSTASTGTTYGGRFEASSDSARAVYGVATATSGGAFGGYFECNSTSGYGLYGRNNASSGTIYGVRGYASTAAGGYAVYAVGDMGATGTKPFRIDHPDDPENKYLLHYAAESPEVINFYRGMVALDERGEAVVNLPPYFAKINTSPSYQLTAVGAPMPGLHIAEKISPEALDAGARAGPRDAAPVCSFRIAGGVPGGEVSWRVEAVRNDLRMRLHGAPVEREKSDSERGKYQHPEYYGQPPEMGMDCDAPQE